MLYLGLLQSISDTRLTRTDQGCLSGTGSSLRRSSSADSGTLSRRASCDLPKAIGDGAGSAPSSLWRLPVSAPPIGSAVQALGGPPTQPRRRSSIDASGPVMRVQRMVAEEAAAAKAVCERAALGRSAGNKLKLRSRAASAAGLATHTLWPSLHALEVGSGDSSSAQYSPRAINQDLAPGSPVASPQSTRGRGESAMAAVPPSPPQARRRAKLESLDKLIGQQPVHHVRLHAAPSQRAYLPQWLAAPLGRARGAAAGAPKQPPPGPSPSNGGLAPIQEHTVGIRSSVDLARQLSTSEGAQRAMSGVQPSCFESAKRDASTVASSK